jgi:hypothetical protein
MIDTIAGASIFVTEKHVYRIAMLKMIHQLQKDTIKKSRLFLVRNSDLIRVMLENLSYLI